MDSSFWLNALILGWSIKYTVRHKLSISGTYFVDIAVPYRALVWDLLAIYHVTGLTQVATWAYFESNYSPYFSN